MVKALAATGELAGAVGVAGEGLRMARKVA